jgi:uncharacterized membrane protein YkoI
MKHRSLLALIAVMALAAGSSIVAATPRSHAAQRKTHSSKRAESGERGEQGEESNEQEQAKLARQAKITLEQAREVARRRAPGNVESAELEREHRQLVYSFDIRNARGTITEVQVNALTGRIARVEHENKKQEAVEKRQEQREKSGNSRRP